MPPAEQITGLQAMALLSCLQPVPALCYSQSFGKQPGLSLSLQIYLEMKCLFLPCFKIDGCGRGYSLSLPVKSWPFGMTVKKKKWADLLFAWAALWTRPAASLAWRGKVSCLSDTWPWAQPAQSFLSKYLESNINNPLLEYLIFLKCLNFRDFWPRDLFSCDVLQQGRPDSARDFLHLWMCELRDGGMFCIPAKALAEPLAECVKFSLKCKGQSLFSLSGL